MSRVVVLGGGVAGLATAGLLARDGHEVTLLEARDELGGRAGVIRDRGFVFDTGPSWWLMPEVFDHFFALMGTSTAEQVDLVALDPAYRVLPEGQPPVDVRSGREHALALAESLEPGAGARLAAHLDSGREAYELAVQRFLHVPWRDPRALVRAIAHPVVLRSLPTLVRLLLETLEARVHRTVADLRLRQVLLYPAVFLGATPRTAPSMYHLMSHLDLEQGVLYPRGGFGTLVDALARLAREHGAHLRTSACAVSIETGTGPSPLAGRAVRMSRGASSAHVTGVRLASGEVVPADLVVSAVDLRVTEALLPEELRDHDEAWWQRLDPGPGAVLVMVGVRDPEGRVAEALAHHTLLFTGDWQRSFDAIVDPALPLPDPTSVYVSRVTASDPGLAPEGCETLFALVPCNADPGLGHGGADGAGDPGVEAIADAALAQVADWAGTGPLDVVVRHTMGPADFEALGSWRGSALGPAHTLRQSAMFRAGNVSGRVDGLYRAGGTVAPGIGLPMCLISAQVVLKHLRGDTSPGPLPTPL